MNSVFYLVFLFFFGAVAETDSLSIKREENSKKVQKWSASFNHVYSRGASYQAKNTVSNSLNASYKLLDWNLSISGSYLLPLTPTSDDTYYGLTDISLSGSRSLDFLKAFFSLDVDGTVGISLPSSEKSLNSGKYFALYGSLAYGKKLSSLLNLSFNHVFYSGFYRYFSNRGGASNRLLSSSHSASLSLSYKNFRFSTSGNLYMYMYLADMNPVVEVTDLDLRFKGGQGASFRLSYGRKLKHLFFSSWNVSAAANLNVPVVEPVLTGFPVFSARNWSYSLGGSWGIK